MNLVRTLAATTLAGAVLAGGATSANAATSADTGSTTTRGYAVCTIHANAPYLSGALIKGDGDLTCTENVAGLQLKVVVQKFVAGRWVAVGVPVQGVRYDVIKVWGTAYTSFAHGTYRTKSTGKVLFYGASTWRPVSAVSAPRTA